MGWVRALFWISFSAVRGEEPKRRMERIGPSMASGGMMALTREPSLRRDHGRRLVDAATDGGDDFVDDLQEMTVVAEGDTGAAENAAALHVDVGGGVDQDVVDGVVFEELFEGAEAEDFVEDFLGDAVALHGTERNALFGDDLLNEGKKLELAGAGFLSLAEFLEVETIDKLRVDSGLEFLLFLFAQGAGIGRGGAQAGTCGAKIVAFRTRRREVERKIAHRYSVLFWPNKEKPLRAG